MIDRLIPRYSTFMVVGLIIVAAGVFVLMAGRDALIAVWIDKLFDGQAVLTGGSFRSDDGLFKASHPDDMVLPGP